MPKTAIFGESAVREKNIFECDHQRYKVEEFLNYDWFYIFFMDEMEMHAPVTFKSSALHIFGNTVEQCVVIFLYLF